VLEQQRQRRLDEGVTALVRRQGHGTGSHPTTLTE